MLHPPVDSSRTSALWRYGLFAINSELLVESKIKVDDQYLTVADNQISLEEFDRVIIVGAGKAGTGMVKGLGKAIARLKTTKQVVGWVNVPDNCVEDLPPINLHPGRPASLNEPTEQGRTGAEKMVELVRLAGPRDIVICLVSGGGSALTPLPVDGVSLDAKLKVTQFLSKNGANINELNSVRSAISQIKGGGLVSSFDGHSFHTLIISDVLGNPLNVIASGMTVPRSNVERSLDIDLARATLQKFDPKREEVDSTIYQRLDDLKSLPDETVWNSPTNVFNHVIGDNATVVNAIESMAKRLGYDVFSHSSAKSEDDVNILADNLLNAMQQRLAKGPFVKPFCFVSGGEPTVKVANATGKGGRNQHLSLLLLGQLADQTLPSNFQFEFVSLGTDGEDGPTDAAGAVINPQVLLNSQESNLDPREYAEANDSYHFFEAVGGLIKTGPTHTNVCDVRIFLMWDDRTDLFHPLPLKT